MEKEVIRNEKITKCDGRIEARVFIRITINRINSFVK